MRRHCYAPIAWICGIVLVAFGIGMLFALCLPFCVPILACFFIITGICLLHRYRFRKHR